MPVFDEFIMDAIPIIQRLSGIEFAERLQTRQYRQRLTILVFKKTPT
jgi:hypothetical protein